MAILLDHTVYMIHSMILRIITLYIDVLCVLRDSQLQESFAPLVLQNCYTIKFGAENMSNIEMSDTFCAKTALLSILVTATF